MSSQAKFEEAKLRLGTLKEDPGMFTIDGGQVLRTYDEQWPSASRGQLIITGMCHKGYTKSSRLGAPPAYLSGMCY